MSRQGIGNYIDPKEEDLKGYYQGVSFLNYLRFSEGDHDGRNGSVEEIPKNHD